MNTARNWMIAVFLTGIALLAGCATQHNPKIFTPPDLNDAVQTGQYVQTANRFLFILDASLSMAEMHQGRQKLEIAKSVVSHITQALPAIDTKGALRVIGGNGDVSETDLIFNFADWSIARSMQTVLDATTNPGGENRLELAMDLAREDLAGIDEQIALIVVSDGLAADTPTDAATRLKAEFGDRLCIYTVQVGDSVLGKQILEQAASESLEWGFSENADNLMTGAGAASFVKNVFLAKAEAPASETLKSEPVAATEPERHASGNDGDKSSLQGDSDNDGVPDGTDNCPGTPKGVSVNAQGCWIIKNILFATNKWKIKPEYYATLDQVAHALVVNPTLHIEIEGHTDNVGGTAENMRLSEKRAKSVLRYLLNKGVSEKRLAAIGHGFSEPVSSNSTKEGRQLNRRVELEPIRIRG